MTPNMYKNNSIEHNKGWFQSAMEISYKSSKEVENTIAQSIKQ